MLKALIRLFTDEKKPEPQKSVLVSDLNGSITDEEIPRYPPFVRGLPLHHPRAIMGTQSELIARIKGILGLTPKEHDELILPLIENCAAFAQLLPASEAHHHRGSGGLFRHSLEVGAWAAQFAEGRIFAYGKTPLERKAEEPRWVVAAFTAGLLHDMGKAASDVAVTSPDGTKEWSPYIESLWEWGQKNNIERYFVRWRESRHKRHEHMVLLLINQLMPSALSAWFGKNPEIIQAMMEAASYRGEHVLTQLVKRGDSTSTDNDQKVTRSLGNELAVGVPVERHILDASRRLISNGTWTVNKKGSRVWVTREGVFIVWRLATEEIVALLSEDRIPGIPQDKDTLAELLLERDLAAWNKEEDPENPNMFWSIAPAILQGRNGPMWLQCLKLTHIETLFSSEPPAPAKITKRSLNGEEVVVPGAHTDTFDPDTKEQPASATDGGEADKGQNSKPSTKKPAAPLEKPKPKSGMRMAAPGDSKQAEPEKPNAIPAKEKQAANEPKTVAPKAPAIDEEARSKASDSEKWLKDNGGEVGTILLKILTDIANDERTADQIFGETGGVMYLRYPDAVRPYSKPSEISQQLTQANWIIPDPENPTRKARDMGDGRGLVLTIELAGHLRNILAINFAGAHAPTQDSASTRKPQPSAVSATTKSSEPTPRPPKAPVTTTANEPVQAPEVSSEPHVDNQPTEAPSGDREGRPPAPVPEITTKVKQVAKAFIVNAVSGKYLAQEEVIRGKKYLKVGNAEMAKLAGQHKVDPPAVRHVLNNTKGVLVIDSWTMIEKEIE